MTKCIVSWCPAQGLDNGLLPGLCVEHRDEVLDKQKSAVEAVERITPTPPPSQEIATMTKSVDEAPQDFVHGLRSRDETLCGLRHPDRRSLGELRIAKDSNEEITCHACKARVAHYFTGAQIDAAIALARKALGKGTRRPDLARDGWSVCSACNYSRPAAEMVGTCGSCGADLDGAA